MADAKKSSFSSLNSLIAFAFIIALLIWGWMVFSAQGEERLEQACKPVEYSTQFLHETTTAIIGRQPTWTLYVQRYLMTGCYYSFSVLFAQGTHQGNELGGGSTGSSLGGDDKPAVGGIRP